MARESSTPRERALLDEQIAYYRARAPEYDEWIFRRGRHDRGAKRNASWFADVAEVERALAEAGPRGHVLEIACGTGLWTRHLALAADRVTALDASPEAIAINRARVASDRVVYRCADVFDWRPDERFDFAFFGFWLSHVPARRFAWFWRRIGESLAPGGRVFFVDNGAVPGETPRDQQRRCGEVVTRRLGDGRRFEIVKLYYEPGALRERLGRLGWRGEIRTTARFLIHGLVSPGDALRRPGAGS